VAWWHNGWRRTCNQEVAGSNPGHVAADRCVGSIMFSGCASVSACVCASGHEIPVGMISYEPMDGISPNFGREDLKVEGSKSRSQQGQILQRILLF